MSLLAPWFLAGLAALAVPVLVHLTHKERKEVVPFPSLMFLERIPYQAVRYQRLRHLLLFVLRCLAVVLLAAAFARPFLSGRNAPLIAAGLGQGRDIVILLDRSYSMEYGDRWRRAVTAAQGVVDKMGSDDRGAVVYFGGTAWPSGDLTDDKAALRAAIDSARPTAGATRYDAALRLALRLLGDTARPRPEIVLVSDYQRSGWDGRELPRLPEGTVLTQITVADTVTANVAVMSVDVRYERRADAPASQLGHERAVVAARLANRSAKPVTRRAVTLEMNGRELQTKPVNLPANGVVSVEFDALPIPAGVSRAVVRAGSDALERDNRFYFVLQRRPSLPVLLVQAPTPGARAGLFLTHALGVGDRSGGDLSFRVVPVRAEQLSANALRTAALVILNDVPVLGGEMGRQLVAYVRDGGGLLVVLGGKSQPGEWPASVTELVPRPAGSPVDRVAERGATLGFLDRGHAVFDAFNASKSGDFSAARFLRYWAVEPGPGDRTLARFGDGRAALVERRFGAGRVLVWTSDLDALWNDLPLEPVFLPLVHQAAKYAAGYKAQRPWAVVGDVMSPSARSVDDAHYVAIAPPPTRAQIRFGVPGAPAALELAEQGFYEIKAAGGAGDSTRTIAVNVDLAESDLTPLDTGLLATAVAVKAGGAAPSPKDLATPAATPADAERRQSLWWYLLLAMVLLLGAETLVSNRLSRTAP